MLFRSAWRLCCKLLNTTVIALIQALLAFCQVHNCPILSWGRCTYTEKNNCSLWGELASSTPQYFQMTPINFVFASLPTTQIMFNLFITQIETQTHMAKGAWCHKICEVCVVCTCIQTRKNERTLMHRILNLFLLLHVHEFYAYALLACQMQFFN